MLLTQREKDVLTHMVVDPQDWADNAESKFGVNARQMLNDKVNKHGSNYDKCVAEGNYKDRVVRDEEERVANLPTPEQAWKTSMIRADNMGMPRYLEDLITDNPALNVNATIKAKYDAKVSLRAGRPA